MCFFVVENSDEVLTKHPLIPFIYKGFSGLKSGFESRRLDQNTAFMQKNRA